MSTFPYHVHMLRWTNLGRTYIRSMYVSIYASASGTYLADPIDNNVVSANWIFQLGITELGRSWLSKLVVCFDEAQSSRLKAWIKPAGFLNSTCPRWEASLDPQKLPDYLSQMFNSIKTVDPHS